MTATLTPSAKQQFFDANGNPLAGGKLYTYTAGTTSPVVTYVDSAGVTTNTNPIILDSRGEANVWLGTGTFKFKLMSATDVEIWTVDNIPGAPSSNAALVALAASNGSSLVGFIQSGTGAVASTVQTKLRESVSVKDFGAVGVGDETAAIQAALTAATGKSLTLNPGVEYTISATLNVPAGTTIIGYGATLKNVTTHITLLSLATGCKVFGLKFIGAGSAYNASGFAIRAIGTRNGVGVAPTYLSDITVQDCIITNCGAYAIEFEYVARSFVTYNTIQNVGYSGVFCFSCDSVLVEGNYIDGLAGETVSGQLNAYGITFTSLISATDLVRDPQSQYCRAIGNLIRNIPTWHGMDTHGGTHCDFIDNRVENCRRGIILTNLVTVGSSYCSVQGNTIINTLTGTNSNGSQKQGEAIWDIGPSAAIRNSRNRITGNSTYQNGDPTATSAAIWIENANEGSVDNNWIDEPYTNGVLIKSNVQRYTVSENTIVDPKGPGIAGGGPTDFPAGINFNGADFYTIDVVGNTIARKNASADVKVAEIGIVTSSTALKSIFLNNNSFQSVVLDFFFPNVTGLTGSFYGSFTATLTGLTTAPTFTVKYSISDKSVVLSWDATTTGTSNSNALTFTGMPTFLSPSSTVYAITRVTDNSVAEFGVSLIDNAALVTFFRGATLNAFTTSGTKGLPPNSISYLLS